MLAVVVLGRGSKSDATLITLWTLVLFNLLAVLILLLLPLLLWIEGFLKGLLVEVPTFPGVLVLGCVLVELLLASFVVTTVRAAA